MIDRSNPAPDSDVVVGSDCSDDDFIRAAMSYAQSCGAPMASAGCSTVVGPRMTTIGSPSTGAVNDDATATLTMTSRKGTTVACRLILPASNAADWEVEDALVGGTSVFPSEDAIFGEAFSSANQRGGQLPFLPAPVSQTIQVRLKNVSGGSAETRIALAGVVL